MNATERYAALTAKGDAERAAWPDRYPVVKRMMGLGFEPWAYGNTDWISRDTTIEEQLDPERIMYRPPTQFGYAAGGLLYPDHAQGPAQGAIFSIYSHADVAYDGPGNLDDVAEQPVWQLYDRREWQARWMGYAEGHLTLDQAARLLIARAQHFRAHYICIEWVTAPHRFRRLPELTVWEWRELATVEPEAPEEPAQPATQQLGLFGIAPKPRPSLRWQPEITAMIAGHPDDERLPSHDLLGSEIEYLVLRANKARHPGVPPVPTLDEVTATADMLCDPDERVPCPVCGGETMTDRTGNATLIPCWLRRHDLCVDGTVSRAEARGILYFMAGVNVPAWGQPWNGTTLKAVDWYCSGSGPAIDEVMA